MPNAYWLLLLTIALIFQNGSAKIQRTPKIGLTQEDIDKIKLSPEGIKKVEMIHGNWHVHSIKALIAQLSKELYRKLDKDQKAAFLQCLDRIYDKKDLQHSAACLIDAKDSYDELRAFRKQKRLRLQPTIFQATTSYPSTTTTIKPTFHRHFNSTRQRPPAKMKMSIWRVQGRKYHYANDDDDEMIHIAPLRESPIIKRLDRKYKKVLQNKHHKEYRSMRKKLRLRRMKRDMAFYYGEQDKKPIPEKRKIINRSKAPHMLAQSFSPVKRFARLIRSFTSDEKMPDSMRWPRKYEQLVSVKKSLDDRENSPGARVYNLRMYDLVLDKKKPDPKGERRLMPSIIQSAYKLMDFFDERKGKKENENDSSNVKFLSPRFFSVMPEKLETPGQLSPSILPLYEDKNEEQILPIPKVMKDVGMSKDDREEILSSIMEAAGANSAVDDAMKVLEQLDIPGLSGELSRVTKEAMRSFENLGKTLSASQKRRLDKLGYALMDKDQIDQFHWDTGLFKNKMIKDAFEAYKNAPSRVEQKNFLWNSIRDIADHDMPHRRKKRQTVVRTPEGVTILSVLNPTILAPYGFTFITGLSVLGPTILSPSLFAPLLLNPGVLSPYILSPAVGMPFILSPYLLSPYILTPIVWAPFVLNPYCLSPNILNPYLMSPLILSPLCLCPDILSPQALGGSILSPGVLSPSIMTKSYLMASVLSPTFLS